MKSFWKSLCLFVASFLLSITILHTLPVGAQTPSRAPVSGSCDCPYDTDSSGRRCGGRSAYSRPGGSSPVCYVNNSSAPNSTTSNRRSAVLTSRDPGSRINVRASASTSATARHYGIDGDRIWVTSQTTGSDGRTWYQVEFPGSGATGWVRGDFVGF